MMRTGVMLLAWVYAGFVLGVSFLATPAKFMAASLPLPMALEVGRQTFWAMHRAEWLLLPLLALFAWRALPMGMAIKTLAPLLFLAATQQLYLQPALDHRVTQIQSGITPPHTQLHNIYIATDAAKVVLLLTLGLMANQQPRSEQ